MKTKFSEEVEYQLMNDGMIDTYFSNGENRAYFNHGIKVGDDDWDLWGVIVTDGGTFSMGCLLSDLEKDGFVYDETKNVRLERYDH